QVFAAIMKFRPFLRFWLLVKTVKSLLKIRKGQWIIEPAKSTSSWSPYLTFYERVKPMNQSEKQEEFYEKFKERLNDTTDFPSNYTYKFIVPTDNKRIAEVQRVFDGSRPQFQMKESKTGKYTSITVVIYALDADQVIYYYKSASSIEDVMML